MLPTLKTQKSKQKVHFNDTLRPSKVLKIPNSSHHKSQSIPNLALLIKHSKIPPAVLQKFLSSDGPTIPPVSTLTSPILHSSLIKPTKSTRVTKYIDKNFQYPFSSNVPNKISYPGDWDYSLKKILTRVDNSDPNLEILEKHLSIDSSFINRRPSPVQYVHEEEKLLFVWREINSPGAQSREGASIVKVKNNLVIFGGQNRLKHSDVVQFNLTNLEYKNLQTVYEPKGCCGHTAVSYKGKMVIYGGYSEYSSKFAQRRCEKKISVLSLKSSRWQVYEGKGQVPKARRSHSSTRIGCSMIIFGGIDKQSRALSSCFALNLKTKIWTYISEGPHKLSQSSLTAIYPNSILDLFNFDISKIPNAYSRKLLEKGIYLYGGLLPDGCANGETWVLKPDEGMTWKKLQTSGKTPTARYNHTSGLISMYFIICGGRNDKFFSKNQELISDIGMLDLESLTWQTVIFSGDPPSSRWSHCSCTYSNKFIIFGGMDYKQYMSSSIYCLEAELY